MVIGHAAFLTVMSPNANFTKLFPVTLETNDGEKPMMPYEVKIGLYALTSAAGNKSGVCSRIQTAYGTENGQALMDYAMHALREAVNTAPLRAERTTDEMLFSAKPHRDSWYSDLFRELPEEQHLRFRTEWLDACREMGAKKVWLCVHGSGPDGDTADWDASASDDNALHSGNSPMASYIVAVSATDGRPVTWYRNEGGTVDSHALQETVAFMASYGLDVEGAIMDPCFCTPGVVQSLKAAHMDYVMGMPRGADGFGYNTKIGPDGIRVEKIPQLGNVEIGDDVEIGANAAIDRARFGSTVVGPHTKIDNLVQIGHNVKVAGYSGIIAQAGVAGSTQIGTGCLIWAQAGVRFKSVDGYVWGFRVHEGSATYKPENKSAIDQEFQTVLRRHNMQHEKFWRTMTRLASVSDGSWIHRIRDSHRFRGKALTDCISRLA